MPWYYRPAAIAFRDDIPDLSQTNWLNGNRLAPKTGLTYTQFHVKS